MPDRDPPTTRAPRPWHREPLVWLVIAIPLLAVIGGLATILIAHRGADQVVTDEISKQGLGVNPDPTRDRAAGLLGVTVELRAADDTLLAHLTVQHGGVAPLPLQLLVVFSHATRTGVDRLVTLERSGAGAGSYAGRLPPLPDGHWYLEVAPPNRAWRLTGEFVDALGTLTLQPRPIS
jgi:uncharacterized protein